MLEISLENWRYKGTFHSWMCTIKDRSDNNLAEACTIKAIQKGLNDLDKQYGVFTDIKVDILESEVKFAF